LRKAFEERIIEEIFNPRSPGEPCEEPVETEYSEEDLEKWRDFYENY
jgi:precorrin-2 methylase